MFTRDDVLALINNSGTLNGVEVVFLPRHGYGHTLPPHDINYRANLWALQHIGVSEIVSVASVGGIRDDLAGRVLHRSRDAAARASERKHRAKDNNRKQGNACLAVTLPNP